MKSTLRHRLLLPARRYVSQDRPKNGPVLLISAAASPEPIASATRAVAKKPSALSVLPTSNVLRSYLITRVSASPVILGACFAIFRRMLHPKAVFFNPDRNPAVHWLLKQTFFAQFCAGENKAEVLQRVELNKRIGFTGVILEYALEVLEGEKGAAMTTEEEIELWRKGMIETVEMASKDDFVALKWSGIGKEALQHLRKNEPPTRAMRDAIIQVCDLAAARDALLIPGAEHEITNSGINSWTLDLQRRYNKARPGRAVMYTTYQAYLRSTPERLARDLAVAKREGFTLGVKMVRGAYLSSEPRSGVWSSKEETDKAFDDLVEAVMTRKYNDFLKPAGRPSAEFPPVSLLIASHNAASFDKARHIRNEQARKGEERIECAYAQLQGMADEISCELVMASKETNGLGPAKDLPRPFKCATWGTVSQCLNFLLRRALENQDAACRTEDTRKAMGQEIWRRCKSAIGLTS